jgi:hypothetical protein
MLTVVFSDSTIIDTDTATITSDVLSSTVISSGGAMPLSPSKLQSSPLPSSSLADALKKALSDSDVLQMIAKAVAGELKKENDELKKEVSRLSKEVDEKSKQIDLLQDRMDDLEQYSRRSCLRISNLPEKADENTDELVLAVAEVAGVTLPPEAVERSHRIGPAPSFADVASGAAKGGTRPTGPRQIIVKLTSYKHREQIMRARKNLRSVNVKDMLPDLDWSTVPAPRHNGPPTTPRIFINEDLTKERARIAAKAREWKREKVIVDTWTRDGIVFIKKDDSNISRVTTYRQLLSLVQ